MAERTAQPGVAVPGDTATFIPIRAASLRTDTVTGFDIYLQPSSGQKPVLYRQRNLPFTEADLARLVESSVQQLLIDSSQQVEYQRYVERNIDAILRDEAIDQADKASLLYVSTQSLVREIFDDPYRGNSMRRSRGFVQSAVAFVVEQRGALGHLLKVSSYDYHVYTHCVNVCVYCTALAQRTGYTDPAVLTELSHGALLHDIGKSLIDPGIVNSRQAPTQREQLLLRRHPILGHDLLSAPGGLGDAGLDIVRHHHEWLNGKGYPDRLSRTRLSRLARIAAIADTFDVLTTRRPFQDALTTFEALRLMASDMRDELDQELVRAFVQMMGNP